MTQLLTILALVLTVTTAFAQTSKSVTYSDSTRKMGPQDLLIKAQGVTTTVGITNEPATANTIAAFGANKELKSAALSGLTFDGTTLSTSGGSGGNWTALGTTNSSLPGTAYMHELVITNALQVGTLEVGTLTLTNDLDASQVVGITEDTQDALDATNLRIDNLTGGYTLHFFGPPAGLNWGDGQTYYFGHDTVGAINTFTGFDKSAFMVDQGGTITSVTIFIASTVGDTNQVTMSLDINNGATVLQVTTEIDLSVTPYRLRVSGLNQAVASGDLITARFLCPTWPTVNPTTIRPYITAFVRPPL